MERLITEHKKKSLEKPPEPERLFLIPRDIRTSTFRMSSMDKKYSKNRGDQCSSPDIADHPSDTPRLLLSPSVPGSAIFRFHAGIVPAFFFFISNRYSAQEFGEVKKLAQRDSNPGSSRRQCDKVTITPQGKSQLTITTR